MEKSASREDFPILIASMVAGARQRRIALGVTVVLTVVLVMVAPFAREQVGRLDAFIPVVQTVLCFADLITATFLFAQYSIQPQRAVLAIASGYIFSGLFAFAMTLDFPGAYSATGLLSGLPSGPPWLFIFWHVAFPLAVVTYVLSKGAHADATPTPRSIRAAVAITIACVLTVIAGLTWLGTAGSGYLPVLFTDLTRETPALQDIVGVTWVLSVIALLLLLIRGRTILDVWLAVTIFVSLPDLGLSFLFPVVRFTLGWYVARSYALIASCMVLSVLIIETMVLYSRLANAIILQRRERAAGLMSVDAATAAFAHEVRQPLAAIASQTGTALNWLNRTPPDLEKIRTSLTKIGLVTQRADEIISSVRALVTKAPHRRTIIQINHLAQQVLALVEHDLRAQGVSVSTSFQEGLPDIAADRTQLEQVILNLVNNAVDAMRSGATPAKTLRLVTRRNGTSVLSLSVQDSGPGIAPDDRDRIFDPFFTTKPTGTGLGLSICRTIIEDHGGDLRLTRTDSHGSDFEIALPIGPNGDRSSQANGAD
jgi:signal transduction histidine kinase